jgi:formate dehydrogenase gamma subunit
VFFAYTIFGYRKYLRKHKINEISLKQKDLFEKFRALQCILFGNGALCLDKKDLMWLKIRILKILGYSDQPLPPQGSFNAGQKLYGLLVALMTPIIMLTGLIMAFHLGPIWLVQWAIPFHFTAVGLVVSGLLIHVYMGAVFPEEKPAFFSMVTGNVSELFLYRHHFDYWKERIVKQCEWLKKSEPDITIMDILPNSLAEKVLEKVEGLKDVQEPVKTVVLEPKPFWSPYVTGTLLGFTLLITYFLLGRGLGASSGFSRVGTFLWNIVAPVYTHANPYWSRYFHGGHTPLGNFMTFEVLGLIFGAFISGWQARRLKIETHKGPHISKFQRLIFAFLGGAFMGLGARIARGCTSGQGMTGGGVLAVGSWVFIIAVFAAGYFSAYIFRRLWL